MNRLIATTICILFILYLFKRDLKKIDGPSNALWIPFIWMFLAGSRYVSSWLNLSSPRTLIEASYDGSPVDAAVFFLLITAGVFILSRRKINWGQLLTQNKWVWLYFLYCGISICWSDYPFISLKRWIKELGNPIMVLVILTDNHPYDATGSILRRLAFLTLPLSILFIWYYPDLARSYHNDGSPMYTGVGHQKNDLGMLCLIAGIYFSWNFFFNRKENFKLGDNAINFMFIGLLAWLLRMADSATSLACLVVAVTLFFLGHVKLVASKPGRIMTLGIIAVFLFSVLEATVGVKDVILGILGRNPTLTNRVPIWDALLTIHANPIVGTGFMSFWAGDRLNVIFAEMGATGVQAHNGYLEQYLNLGYIGVAFIGIIILTGLFKVRRHLALDYPSAMLRLCFIVTAILYNYTEASFYGVNNMWLLLLLGIIEISDHQLPNRTDKR
jgi:O-antigen ligase